MQDVWKSYLLDFPIRDERIVSFNLFPSQSDEVNPTLMVLRQAVVLAELLIAVFAVVTQHIGLFITLQTSTCHFLGRRQIRSLSFLTCNLS